LWKPLGESELLGCSEKQVRYAAARLGGAKMAASCRIAGYGGKHHKQTAQTVDRSPKVPRPMARAREEIAARKNARR
jgi:hypothetical protein